MECLDTEYIEKMQIVRTILQRLDSKLYNSDYLTVEDRIKVLEGDLGTALLEMKQAARKATKRMAQRERSTM